jgi:hypothetical protein
MVLKVTPIAKGVCKLLHTSQNGIANNEVRLKVLQI